jgi:hypothetical protein
MTSGHHAPQLEIDGALPVQTELLPQEVLTVLIANAELKRYGVRVNAIARAAATRPHHIAVAVTEFPDCYRLDRLSRLALFRNASALPRVAAVTITTRTASRRRSHRHSEWSSDDIFSLMALCRSGRFSVTVAIASDSS